MQPSRNRFPRRAPGWIELSVALAALFVSGASLYIARQQTAVMHRQLAASIWPALEYSTSNLRGGEPPIAVTGVRDAATAGTRRPPPATDGVIP